MIVFLLLGTGINLLELIALHPEVFAEHRIRIAVLGMILQLQRTQQEHSADFCSWLAQYPNKSINMSTLIQIPLSLQTEKRFLLWSQVPIISLFGFQVPVPITTLQLLSILLILISATLFLFMKIQLPHPQSII